MWWDVEIAGFTVTLFTVRRVSSIRTIPIIVVLHGKTVTVWLPSTPPTFLPLVHTCISIGLWQWIGPGFSRAFYVTNFLAYVWNLWGEELYSWHAQSKKRTLREWAEARTGFVSMARLKMLVIKRWRCSKQVWNECRVARNGKQEKGNSMRMRTQWCYGKSKLEEWKYDDKSRQSSLNIYLAYIYNIFY